MRFDPVWRQAVNNLFILHLLLLEITKKWRVKKMNRLEVAYEI